jgi:hypothetical protein
MYLVMVLEEKCHRLRYLDNAARLMLLKGNLVEMMMLFPRAIKTFRFSQDSFILILEFISVLKKLLFSH